MKDYWFRANTVSPLAPPSGAAFATIERETSPTFATTLAPGDVLFLPRSVWHVARARETSWSISLGLSASVRVFAPLEGA